MRDNRFSTWLRTSNEAGKYRDAFALIDKMDADVRIDLILQLTRKASAEHHKLEAERDD